MKPRNCSPERWESEALQSYLADESAYRRIRSACDLEALIRYASLEKRFLCRTTTSSDPTPDFEQRLVALFAE